MASEVYERTIFFDSVRASLFGTLTQQQVDGQEYLLKHWEDLIEYEDRRWFAYVLATQLHECAWTCTPISEYGGSSTRYAPWYGRGYVQLTWEENYIRADNELELNGRLINDLEVALEPDIALQIIARGMAQGWFTGKKLSDYISGTKCDYANARRIVNGTDKMDLIAGYAEKYEVALNESAMERTTEPTEPVEPPVVEPPPTNRPPMEKPTTLPATRPTFGGEVLPPQTVKTLVEDLKHVSGASEIVLKF